MQHLHHQPLLSHLVVAADTQAPKPVLLQGPLQKGPCVAEPGFGSRAEPRAHTWAAYLLEFVQVILFDALTGGALV